MTDTLNSTICLRQTYLGFGFVFVNYLLYFLYRKSEVSSVVVRYASSVDVGTHQVYLASQCVSTNVSSVQLCSNTTLYLSDHACSSISCELSHSLYLTSSLVLGATVAVGGWIWFLYRLYVQADESYEASSDRQWLHVSLALIVVEPASLTAVLCTPHTGQYQVGGFIHSFGFAVFAISTILTPWLLSFQVDSSAVHKVAWRRIIILVVLAVTIVFLDIADKDVFIWFERMFILFYFLTNVMIIKTTMDIQPKD